MADRDGRPSRWARVRDVVGRTDLRAGMVTGLVSSAFSTLFVQLGARQIGRDPNVDWMQVGTVPMRARALDRRPKAPGIAAGIGAHSFADFQWATMFLGLFLRRVPRPRRGRVIGWSAAPWALATAAVEYWVFLPWVQPILRMQVPYWTAAGVHMSSAAAYPLFLAVRHRDRRAGGFTMAAMVAILAMLALVRRSETQRAVPRWPRSDDGDLRAERRYFRRMTAHHGVGLRFSELAVERSEDPEMVDLGKIMAAQHAAELDVMRTWWTSWFGGKVPDITDEEREEMPGMPPPEQVDRLSGRTGSDFDRALAELMVPHHRGAIRMSREVIQEGRDQRVKLLARSVVHTQQRQIARMDELVPEADTGGTVASSPRLADG